MELHVLPGVILIRWPLRECMMWCECTSRGSILKPSAYKTR
uniref:Uncharacterized protein n=1 Tax=Anguilla anguilla TaxID=7936 RepID=A0A0E9SX21_ANGAN